MTPEQEALVKLAERAEAAIGPDRELDRAIELAVLSDRIAPAPDIPLLTYTASLDAAMSLVPEGWHSWDVDATVPEIGIDWTLWEQVPDGCKVKGSSEFAALALCAAALRARALIGEGEGE